MAAQPHVPFDAFIHAFAPIWFWFPRHDMGRWGSVRHALCAKVRQTRVAM